MAYNRENYLRIKEEFAHRHECVEIGYVNCKIVVKLGELGELDRVELALEYGGLACELCMTVILGEGHVYIELVAYAMTDYLLLEAGDEGAGAELERVVLALAAVELLIVSKTHVLLRVSAAPTANAISISEAALTNSHSKAWNAAPNTAVSESP